MTTFNAAGLSVLGYHYAIAPLSGTDLAEIESLIAQRQTGKTTALLASMHHLNAHGQHRALDANIEAGRAVCADVGVCITIIASAIANAASLCLEDQRINDWLRQRGEHIHAEDRLSSLLVHWAQVSDRPVVLFLDEVDVFVGDTLISLLCQIRVDYVQRSEAFQPLPQSLVEQTYMAARCGAGGAYHWRPGGRKSFKFDSCTQQFHKRYRRI